MRLAILSDIHGNLEAFRNVLADLDHTGVDEIISLGDNIGYGPEPDQVLRCVHKRKIHSIMGNHELGIVDPSCLSWFNASARKSILITRELLSPWGIDFISALKATHEFANGLCVHGFPPDSMTTYLFQVPDEQLLCQFLAAPYHMCFVGHTHELGVLDFDGMRIEHKSLREGTHRLLKDHKYIINAGSVGQPRDGDNRAKYLIWDETSLSLEVRCIAYDIARTAQKILDLGFPRINADRLW